MSPNDLLVAATCIEGAYKGRNITGYYVKHEGPLHAFYEGKDPEDEVRHLIVKTGFADWNMTRPIDSYLIDVNTLHKAVLCGVGKCEEDVTKEDWVDSGRFKIGVCDFHYDQKHPKEKVS